MKTKNKFLQFFEPVSLCYSIVHFPVDSSPINIGDATYVKQSDVPVECAPSFDAPI